MTASIILNYREYQQKTAFKVDKEYKTSRKSITLKEQSFFQFYKNELVSQLLMKFYSDTFQSDNM